MDQYQFAVSDAHNNGAQTLFQRLRLLRQENYRIRKQLVSINEQWQQLGQAHRALSLQQEQLVKSDELRDTIDAYSRQATFEIAQNLQSKLPRELRDIIQALLWDPNLPEHFQPMRNEEDLADIFRRKCPGRPCECLRHVTVHPWLDPVWVGPDTALESAEMIYRQIVGMYADSPEMIIDQLYADPFHVGFTPLSVIDSFTIEINVDYCLRKQRRSIELAKKKPGERPYSMLDTLAEAAEHLLLVPKKRDFVLDLTLVQRYIRPRVLSEIVGVLKPMIETFEMEGAEINIWFNYYNEKGTRDPDQAKFVWDLSDIHKSEEQEWKTELVAALDNLPWILKRHRTYNDRSETWFDARSDYDRRSNKELWADAENEKLEDDGHDPFYVRERLQVARDDESAQKRRRKRRKCF